MNTYNHVSPSSLPLYAQSTQPLPRLQRTWPALLTLYFLSPVIGEVLSGSTPVLSFFQLFSLLYLPALYGSGAILVRELARRRGLGQHFTLSGSIWDIRRRSRCHQLVQSPLA